MILLRGERTRAIFAEEIGIHVNTLGGYERGERSPDLEFLTLLRQKTGVDINWLATGEGAPFPSAGGSNAQIDTTLYQRITDIVRHAHNEANVTLPGDRLSQETLRHYNNLAADMVGASTKELDLRLGLLEIQIAAGLDEARAEPGTGKRSAS